MLILLLLLSGMIFSVATGRLTIAAAITGGILCTVIYLGTGWPGVWMMTLFFVMGTLATSWKKNLKERLGMAEANKGKRNAGQVMANAGVAGGIALLAWVYPPSAHAGPLLVACC